MTPKVRQLATSDQNEPTRSVRGLPRAPKTRRLQLVALVAVVLGAGIGAAEMIGLRRLHRTTEALDRYGALPDFSLVDQLGRPVKAADLAGTIVIANFIFTRCPTVCPTFSMKMQRVAERVADVERILLISFSVDPEHDTSEVLREFASKFEASPSQWRFLTGDHETIVERVAGGMALAVERGEPLPTGDPDIVHSTHFVLIDSQREIRGYYNSSVTERIDDLVRDATALAEQL